MASGRKWDLVGLCAIAASTVVVEITITKFLAYKVHHHATYAVISMVVLSLGAAGLFVYLRPGSWSGISRAATIYAVGVAPATLIFCWLPLDPYHPDVPAWLAGASVPVYLLLFSLPLFFAGVCISHTLAHAEHPVTTIYFWDLIAAAAGAILCPLLLSHIGGYATLGVAGALGMVASMAFARVDGSVSTRTQLGGWSLFALSALGLAAYPGWAVAAYGFDVRSFKDFAHRDVFRNDFGGIARTEWNGVARIDVSHTGQSNSVMYRFGLPAWSYDDNILGRYVLLDGGANTRQFVATGEVADQKYLGGALWASPYVAHGPARRTLILGAGGGIDILVAKHFGTPTVHAVELNPAIFSLLQGTAADPEHDRYAPWLKSDARSKVTIVNGEGRHVCSKRPDDYYDIIQASGVDTLTAISTGGNSLVENYLYTREAVDTYLRVLRPGGVLSLTHWRGAPPRFGMRMFVTYIDALERAGVTEPHRHLLVVGDSVWVDTLLKTTPFEQSEVARMRTWAAAQGHTVVFDPQRSVDGVAEEPALWPGEQLYTMIAHATPHDRAALLARYPIDVTPVSDDRPYFYRLDKQGGWFATAFPDSTIRWLFLSSMLWALTLVLIPLRRVAQRGLSRNMLQHAAFFAGSGFAFLLFEAAIIQLLSVFVGGPAYSLAVVLVSVLGGYAIGSRIAAHIPPTPRSYVIIGATLSVLLVAVVLGLPSLLRAASGLPFIARVALAVGVTLIPSIVVGMPVPLAMSQLRHEHGDVVAWMWGVSSAFNVIGGMSFVPLSQLWGISGALVVVTLTYAVANMGMAWALPRARVA